MPEGHPCIWPEDITGALSGEQECGTCSGRGVWMDEPCPDCGGDDGSRYEPLPDPVVPTNG